MKYHSYEDKSTLTQTCNVHNLIKTLRKMSHMSQRALGDLLGVTQQEISKLEGENANITINMLCDICSKLNIFPIITFSSNEVVATLDPQLINAFESLKEFPPEKQTLIFELIRLLS